MIEDPDEARRIALNLLNHSARTESQLREKLVSRGVTDQVADELIDRYREVGLVDDAAFARSMAGAHFRDKKLARREISIRMQRKGLQREDIDDALAGISDDDERDAAFELAHARWVRLEGKEPAARTRTVVSMLARKGYGPDVAYSVVDRLARDTDL